MVKDNFDLISIFYLFYCFLVNHLRSLRRSEHLLIEGIQHNKKLKEKLRYIKEHYLFVSLKITLKKQKMKNLVLLKNFLEENLGMWIKKIKYTKELKKKKSFSQLFFKYSELKDEINIFNSNNKLIKRSKSLVSKSFLDKINQKMEKLKENFDEEFKSIFYEKKTNINDIFNLFKTLKIEDNKNPLEEFLNNIKIILRDTIFKICKEKIIPFTKENISNIDNNDINENKFSFFQKFTIKENNLFNCIPLILKSIFPISEIYKFYMSENNEIKNFFYEKREIIFSIIEKKISKIIFILFNDIPNIKNNSFSNKKNFYMLLSIINIFLESLKKELEIKESYHLNKLLQSLINLQLKAILKIHIRKIGILLEGDNWKRLALQDNNEIFSEMKSNIPLYFKKFLPYFNKEGEDYLNNIKNISVSKIENIKDLFFKMSENLDNFFSPKKIKYNYDSDVQILSKKLDNSKIIISTSSYSVLKSYKEIIDNAILFDKISYEIYIELFNLGDYFILSSVNLLMIKKIYLSQIFQLLNIEEVKKTNNLTEYFPYALYLNNYKEMRLLFLITRDNLSKLYDGINVDFLNNNNQDDNTNNVYFPKLNPDININTNDIYNLLIESIIVIESIISIYKYIKRLRFIIKEEKEEEKNIINKKLDLYKIAIKEIKQYIYKPLCHNIFKMEPILTKINNQKWVLNENDNLDFSDASPFIYSILDEIYEKYDKLNLLSNGSLTYQSEIRFIDIVIKYFVENLQISVCLIKNINSTGRSIFLKDIKILKMKLEEKFKFYKKKINFEENFSQLSLFLNSWYSNQEELIQYIQETKLDYKYMSYILDKGDYFEKLSSKEKENFKKKVDEVYINLLKEINDNLLNNFSNR